MQEPPEPPMSGHAEIEAFLRSLDYPDEGRAGYVEIHMERFVRTLTMVPPLPRPAACWSLGLTCK